ncbi:MAG: hypothetical protein M3Q77_06905 [Thermoproteota archaeon]|nr:hypothetical protein [Nitrosopumilus sp.]MDQ3084529.1 hypothetical protein [Thermoproteota archaeon]
MKILNVFTLIGVIASFFTLGGILIPAMAQPIDNNQTLTTVEPPREGNLTSNAGSNMSNITTPAGEVNTYR